MHPRDITRLILVPLTFVVGSVPWSVGAQASATARVRNFTEQERAELIQYASDTWRSFQMMAQPSGLPADGLSREGGGWGKPAMQTSPTNIGAYLWSTIAAERLGIIPRTECHARLDRTLRTLAAMERHHGFYLNDLDPRTGQFLKVSPWDSSLKRPLVSAVDNAWLAMALWMVARAEPSLRPQAEHILDGMDFRFFYDGYDERAPTQRPGQIRVGYWVDDRSFYGHYGMLNSEARIASYLGITRGQLPREHYYRLYRTFPEHLGAQEQVPQGVEREYLGVRVFEGTYAYRGKRIVPSWGGSMFEALMVPLFVPEESWAPRSWGVNHPLYVRAQIEHGMEDAGYGYWGFSPATSPRGGYQVYGVKALGTDPTGYQSFDLNGLIPQLVPSHSSLKMAHGVVTPHASFLALRYAPHESLANLRALVNRFPIYSSFGFLDSVDVTAGVVSGWVLALDQGMIMAAIANELADDVMRRTFSDGDVEQSIRPLIAMEEFSSGPPVRMTGAAARLLLRQPMEVRIR